MSNHIVSPTILTFAASGKFMLFGEYLVLQGADCLAIPLKFGQELSLQESPENYFSWESQYQEETWFKAKFNSHFQLIETSDEKTAKVLLNLLQLIYNENPDLFATNLDFVAKADFDLKWGLGSSSTLISLLAQWSGVDPYFLLENSFGGSGYDIACATVDSPITYSSKNNEVRFARLSPAITNKILFVYSGNKQNSKNEVKRFSTLAFNVSDVSKINKIIENAQAASDIETFELQMEQSEVLLSSILNRETIKSKYFENYPFAIKSMGAWGGDFFMATYRNEVEAKAYFENLGYTTQFTYSEIIKA